MRTDRYNRAFSPRDTLSLPDLEIVVDEWFGQAAVSALSRGTLENRRYVAGRLTWWLGHAGKCECGPSEVRGFLAYLNTAHLTPAGRWETGRKKPMRPVSARFFYNYLSSLFGYAVAQRDLEESPLARIQPPKVRTDQVQPLTEEEFGALLRAAERGKHPLRDLAILMFLVDTGARVSEACSVKRGDVDLVGKKVAVLGKGNKERTLRFGRETRRALWRLLREEPAAPEAALFRSERGRGHLTRSGVLRLVSKLGDAAGLEQVRCSPHTLRHTFSVTFLRAGGGALALKELLGHETLAMTTRYVNFAQADMARQHENFSPGDRLKRR